MTEKGKSPQKEVREENLHINHRKRLKEQLHMGASAGMSDYTLLEFVLSFAIPRKNTNPLAHKLIDHFGSFDKVFEATIEDFKDEQLKGLGIGPHTISFLGIFLPVLRRYLECQSGKHFSNSDKEAIRKFLYSKYLSVCYERAMLLNFNSQGMLINYDFIADGDFGQVDLNRRKIASSIIKSQATSSILVHNHPSGICKPSVEDLICVKELKNFLEQLDVTLIDSVILTEDSIFFFSGDPSLFDYIY